MRGIIFVKTGETTMKRAKLRKIKNRIRKLYKELIKAHKKTKYKEKIVNLNEKRNGNLVFQLRFIKNGKDCKYYRVLVRDNF